MHANARRVHDALRALGADGEVRELTDSARTAADAAAALGCEIGAIANSLVFVADDTPVLVLTSGAHRADTGTLATVLGAAQVRKADPDTVRDATGFPIGGVPPVGHRTALRTVVDMALQGHETVWAAAGTPHAVFPTTYDELLRLTGGEPAEVG